jgi:hypothetical protein
VEVNIRKAVDQEIKRTTFGALERVAEVVRTQAAAELALPGAAVDLQVVEVENRPTEFKDRVRTSSKTRTVAPYRREISFNTPYGTGKTVVGWNQPIGTLATELAGYSAAAWQIDVGGHDNTDFSRESWSYVVRPRTAVVDMIDRGPKVWTKDFDQDKEDQAGGKWKRSVKLREATRWFSSLLGAVSTWEGWKDGDGGFENQEIRGESLSTYTNNVGRKVYKLHVKWAKVSPWIRQSDSTPIPTTETAIIGGDD